jgi:hypothetical protein
MRVGGRSLPNSILVGGRLVSPTASSQVGRGGVLRRRAAQGTHTDGAVGRARHPRAIDARARLRMRRPTPDIATRRSLRCRCRSRHRSLDAGLGAHARCGPAWDRVQAGRHGRSIARRWRVLRSRLQRARAAAPGLGRCRAALPGAALCRRQSGRRSGRSDSGRASDAGVAAAPLTPLHLRSGA